MKDVSWEHTQRWLIVPETGIHFFKNGAFLTLRAPTARKVTMEFRGQLYLTTSAVRELYRREVEYLDGRIGELLAALDRLGLRDKTAVVAVGDHGEGLGEYNLESGAIHYGHVNFLEKIYLHVPLIVSIPGDPAKRLAADRTRHPYWTSRPRFSSFSALRGFAGFPAATFSRFPTGAIGRRCSRRPTGRNRTGIVSPCSRRPGT